MVKGEWNVNHTLWRRREFWKQAQRQVKVLGAIHLGAQATGFFDHGGFPNSEMTQVHLGQQEFG